MSQSNSSGDAFKDSLNFVKNLWGQMAVPGMPSGIVMPTPGMSMEDLDKRLQELKTVETWLNVNMTMLRNTIQALEVQRATIATLHSLSSTMSQTMQGATAATTGTKAESTEDAASPLGQSTAWWQGVQDQFKFALGTALEKSAANFAAAQSASEEIVKATTANLTPSEPTPKAKPAAARKAAPAATRKAAPSRSRKTL